MILTEVDLISQDADTEPKRRRSPGEKIYADELGRVKSQYKSGVDIDPGFRSSMMDRATKLEV